MNGRDVFFKYLVEKAEKDKDIVVIIADSSAPCFDSFRNSFPDRFINVGIAEQNLLSVGSGLALTGKKVYVYALNPFPVTRAFDQLRGLLSGLNVPVNIICFNSGTSAAACGYTHMPLENFAMLRTLPNVKSYIPSDNTQSVKIAIQTLNSPKPAVIQFEKFLDSDIYESDEIDLEKGYCCRGAGEEIAVVASGYPVKIINEILSDSKELNDSIRLIDCFSFPLSAVGLIEELSLCKRILTIEDNSPEGGLGSFILEILSDYAITKKVKRLSINLDRSTHIIETRETLYEKNSMNKCAVRELLENMAGLK